MTGTPNSEKHVSGASINADQIESFDEFMDAFYTAFPGGQAWGHVDVDNKGKVDPGFDVQEYVVNWFGKTNLSTSGKDKPITPAVARSQFTESQKILLGLA